MAAVTNLPIAATDPSSVELLMFIWAATSPDGQELGWCRYNFTWPGFTLSRMEIVRGINEN